WICPSCGFSDGKSPAVVCQKCNEWHHWTCVSLCNVPPGDMDWYCVRCLNQDPTLRNQTK
ncbi:hypothetical protein HELRODRAFT_128334, partial [Helobdella robusta]|uniref:PHD-type domain-containing protein n=1 Tax=Helobdella robusta TaxID=6412 RepID=T1EHM8_HELRO